MFPSHEHDSATQSVETRGIVACVGVNEQIRPHAAGELPSQPCSVERFQRAFPRALLDFHIFTRNLLPTKLTAKGAVHQSDQEGQPAMKEWASVAPIAHFGWFSEMKWACQRLRICTVRITDASG